MLVFVLGLIFITSPTAITSTNINSTYSFYPDLFLCFVFSTFLNRPKILSLYSVLFLLLLSDILQMKPIGLLTTIVLISFIILKSYEQQIESSSFYIHYFIFFGMLSCIQTLNIFLHHLLFIPKPNLITILNQTVFTLICYPLFDIPYKLVKAKKR